MPAIASSEPSGIELAGDSLKTKSAEVKLAKVELDALSRSNNPPLGPVPNPLGKGPPMLF